MQPKSNTFAIHFVAIDLELGETDDEFGEKLDRYDSLWPLIELFCRGTMNHSWLDDLFH